MASKTEKAASRPSRFVLLPTVRALIPVPPALADRAKCIRKDTDRRRDHRQEARRPGGKHVVLAGNGQKVRGLDVSQGPYEGGRGDFS
jgi:hypothetical protein